MIKELAIHINSSEIMSCASDMAAKSLLLKRAKSAGWPVITSTSLDMKLPSGFTVHKSEDVLNMVTTYKVTGGDDE